ncbi:MAG: acyl dehydratase [Microbacteriaceae bacterium]|nr:acyl dehydratase [Microbacteriaceae bacterium]
MTNSKKLEVGQVLITRDVDFTRDSLVRYAGASGDFNQIHYRDDVAARVGLPGVLAHGMLTMGTAISPLVEWLGDPARLLSYGVRFTKPIVVPADGAVAVHIEAVVGAVDEEAGTARIDLKVSVEGEMVLGKAQAVIQI